MAKMGFRTFQEMIGRTDKLLVSPDPQNPKAMLIDFHNVLQDALKMRPGVNVVAGTTPQDFQLEKRLVCILEKRTIIVKCV